MYDGSLATKVTVCGDIIITERLSYKQEVEAYLKTHSIKDLFSENTYKILTGKIY